MNLIDRYVSAVAQLLPASRRNDIARELKANILDRLESFAEEHGRPTTPADESAVLRELGHPRQVAASFMPPRQLVSPAWFPFFTQCLAYGLVIVAGVQALGAAVALVGGGHFSIGGLVGGWIHSSLLMFASVTGVFFILSNLPATANLSPYCKWRPEDLPPVRQPWQRISLFDSAMELVGNLFFLGVILYFWLVSDAAVPAWPITAGPGLKAWALPLVASALIALSISLWNLRQAYWTSTKLILSVIFRLAFALLCGLIAQTPDKLALIGNAQTASNIAIVTHLSFWIFVGAGCISLFEAGRSAYRLLLLRQQPNV